MFQDSLFSSAPSPISPTRKLAASAAISAQIAFVALAAIAPLLHPATLALATSPPIVTLPRPLRSIPPPTPSRPAQNNLAASTAALRSSTVTPPARLALTHGHIVPGIPADAPVLSPIGDNTMSLSTSTGLALAAIPSVISSPIVRPAAPRRPRLSSGVSSGMLLAPIRPLYPPIALAARQEGTVTLTATIDKTGKIAGLQVISGPAMLRASALEAVSVARYKPYLLNGEPTEVETTISVIFHLG